MSQPALRDLFFTSSTISDIVSFGSDDDLIQLFIENNQNHNSNICKKTQENKKKMCLKCGARTFKHHNLKKYQFNFCDDCRCNTDRKCEHEDCPDPQRLYGQGGQPKRSRSGCDRPAALKVSNSGRITRCLDCRRLERKRQLRYQ